jgi:molybdenum cofactor cytidylyltransferase
VTAGRIAGILLAAGEAKRLGRLKQLLVWNGRPLVEHAARTALAAGLDPIVAVIGYCADEVRAAIRAPVSIVENPRWPDGLSTSVHAGLLALPSDVDAAIMLPVDQPRLTADHLRALVAAYRASGKPIAGSSRGGRRASPTLFDRSLFDQLLQVTGDVGGRPIMDANPQWVEAVEAEDERELMDVDTLGDWQRILDG